LFQVTDIAVRNNSSGTSGSASSPSSGVSSQLTGGHPQQQQQHTSNQQNNSLAAQLVSQQLLMQNALGALAPQDIQALASTLQQHQQSLQQQLHQYAMFQQANSTTTTGQLPPHAQFFLQNQVSIRVRMERSTRKVQVRGICISELRAFDAPLMTKLPSNYLPARCLESRFAPVRFRRQDRQDPKAATFRPRYLIERGLDESECLILLCDCSPSLPSPPPLTPLSLFLARARPIQHRDSRLATAQRPGMLASRLDSPVRCAQTAPICNRITAEFRAPLGRIKVFEGSAVSVTLG